MVSPRIVSEVTILDVLTIHSQIKQLPADLLHCFNFFTLSFKMEYLKLYNDVIPAYSNVKRPIF